MGTLLYLRIGQLELDWGKNDMFDNHSKLFLPNDLKLMTFYDEHKNESNHVETRLAFVRSLGGMLKRLELLGYTMEECRASYEQLGHHLPELYGKPDIDFDQLRQVVSAFDIDRLKSLPYQEYGFGEYEVLHPYVTLRLLAENKQNLGKDVVWDHRDAVEAGWVSEDNIYEGVDESDRYLVVTEGSSDADILRKSLSLLFPEVDDLFTFIDTKEKYPFFGVSKLADFCIGLAKINIQNKVLAIFDNDTAGNEAYMKVRATKLPRNMRLAILPYMPEFEDFPTIGPSGGMSSNVNGEAVAIEMFLDLTKGPIKWPFVRWTSYSKPLDRYQGELDEKELFVKEFHNTRVFSSGYDLSKLRKLWEHLIRCCIDPPPPPFR